MKKKPLKSPQISRLLRLYSLRAFPRNNPATTVAWAVFWGVWIGVMPTIGVAILLTLLFCWVFKLPKSPAIAASFVSNPFTVPLFYVGGYWLGRQILNPPPVEFDLIKIFTESKFSEIFEKLGAVMAESPPHMYSFLLGMLIVASFVAALFWVIAYYMVLYRQAQKRSQKSR